jgi:methyl-accepting chemotaxis protein
MRTNLPVTNNEVQLTDATLIVSKTDLKGRITYVNKDFLDISGFTEAELIGEPHNLVRHPGHAGGSLRGLCGTRSRRAPMDRLCQEPLQERRLLLGAGERRADLENGQVTGYLSVRRKASTRAIEAHEAAYRQFREKRQGRLKSSASARP